MRTIEQFERVPESGIIIRKEGAIIRVFFGIKEVTQKSPDDKAEAKKGEDSDAQQGVKLYEGYTVDVNGRTYADIVAAIVNDKYSSNDVQALQSNYIEAKDAESELTEAKREEYLAEWTNFQNWRKQAKEVAAEAVKMINE